MLIHGGLASTGTERTCGVCGAYWMSSIRSFLNTTLPGVAARFSPTRNGRVSTWRGRPLLLSTSSTKWLAPATRLAPPVSNIRFSAAGLVSRKFVGASASSRKPVASAALASSTAFPDPASSRSLTRRDVARCACRRAKKAGLSVHVGSANRLSFSGTGTGGGASIPIQRAAATGPAIATLVQKRIAADAVAVGLAAARRSTANVEEPSPAASTEASTSASGASAAAADSAACHAVSCAVISSLLGAVGAPPTLLGPGTRVKMHIQLSRPVTPQNRQTSRLSA